MKGENKSVVHTLKLGSLYLDEKPVTSCAEYRSGQTISFGAATPSKTISWVPVNGLLIADRCLLTDISWDDIEAQGLVFGREIELCGFRFRARLLKVGNSEGVPNEWDAALDVVGENDDLWHWEDMFFWGQETVLTDASSRAYRGYRSARLWSWNNSSYRYATLGFRPALEPLATVPTTLKLGQDVLAIGKDGAVVGKLMDATTYDLVIQPNADGLVGKAAFAANMRNGTVAVDRQGILSIAAA
mgnify:CR=1 FL=1